METREPRRDHSPADLGQGLEKPKRNDDRRALALAPLSFLLLGLGLLKFQTDGVDAVSLASGFWPVIKHVSKMAFALAADDLDSFHPERIVLVKFHISLAGGLPKAWPAGA